MKYLSHVINSISLILWRPSNFQVIAQLILMLVLSSEQQVLMNTAAIALRVHRNIPRVDSGLCCTSLGIAATIWLRTSIFCKVLGAITVVISFIHQICQTVSSIQAQGRIILLWELSLEDAMCVDVTENISGQKLWLRILFVIYLFPVSAILKVKKSRLPKFEFLKKDNGDN